jgi:hypothetical protein
LSAVLVLNIVLNVVWVWQRHGLKDLGSFLHSGASYLQGLNPYAFNALVDPQPLSQEALNLNPPISVYVFAYLSTFDPGVIQIVFMCASLALFGAAFYALLRAYPEKQNLLTVLAVVAMAGVWHMLWYQQLYAWLLALVTGAWLLMRGGRLTPAGVLLGLVVAIKPNFALLLLLLLAARHGRVAAAGIITAGAVSVIPLALDGFAIYRQWFDLSLAFDGLSWTSNASLMSLGARLGLPSVGLVATVVAVLGLVYWQWKARPPVLETTAVALLAVLLTGPVSWAGYTLFLLPWLLATRWTPMIWAGVLLLDVPFSPVGAVHALGGPALGAASVLPSLQLPDVLAGLLGAVAGSVYLWALLALLASAAKRRRTRVTRRWQPRSLPRPRRADDARSRRLPSPLAVDLALPLPLGPSLNLTE